MKTTTLFKGFGTQQTSTFWSLEDPFDDWNGINSEKYLVEIPEGFYLDESNSGEQLFFKENESVGYVVVTKGVWPYLANAMDTDPRYATTKIKVIKRIDE